MSRATAAAVSDDDLIALYESGESVKALAERFDTSRPTITRRLKRLGITPRNPSEAQFLLSSRRSPEERRRLAAFAFEARRGRSNSAKALSRAAVTREKRGVFITESEMRLAEWLQAREVPVRHQVAVGPYNCDLAAEPVAIEVFGGNWHASGDHVRRYPSRCDQLLQGGWALVIAWDQARCPLSEGAADYTADFYKATLGNPALIGEYRVIMGNGRELARGPPPFSPAALVPSQRKT